MQPTLRLDRTVVAVLIDNVVHFLLELQAPEAPASDRAPVDTVVVIDRSGSMSGAPLDSVTRATAELLRLAGPDDRIGVVSFDDTVDLVLPLDRHDADRAAATVRNIRSGGSTNLSGGWLKALEMLTTSPRPGAVTRIVVLTDGHANAGVTDAAQLCGMASSAREQGVTTTCIGFDDGYDEQLLAGIADAGGGNDYWCAGPDQAGVVFRAEFDGLANVVAQNVSVEIRGTDVVQECLVLNEFPMTAVSGGVQVALGDAFGGERRRVVAMLRLSPQADEGTLQVADVVIRYAAIGEDVALHTITLPVTVQVGAGADDVSADPEVVEQVMLLKAAQAQKEAARLADQGDYTQAAERMDAALGILTESNAVAPEVLLEMRTDAERLRRRTWDSASSKKHFSASRSAQKSRNLRFDQQSSDDTDLF